VNPPPPPPAAARHPLTVVLMLFDLKRKTRGELLKFHKPTWMQGTLREPLTFYYFDASFENHVSYFTALSVTYECVSKRFRTESQQNK